MADEVPIQQNNIPGGENYKKVEHPLKKIIINNFVGGISWSVGVLIGASIVIGIAAYFARRIDFVPLFGHFFAEVLKSAQSNLQQTGTPIQ